MCREPLGLVEASFGRGEYAYTRKYNEIWCHGTVCTGSYSLVMSSWDPKSWICTQYKHSELLKHNILSERVQTKLLTASEAVQVQRDTQWCLGTVDCLAAKIAAARTDFVHNFDHLTRITTTPEPVARHPFGHHPSESHSNGKGMFLIKTNLERFLCKSRTLFLKLGDDFQKQHEELMAELSSLPVGGGF